MSQFTNQELAHMHIYQSLSDESIKLR